MSQDEVLDHVEELVAATDLPLSADLENCFDHYLDGVAPTAQEAIDIGVAGFSVEDFTGNEDDPIGRPQGAAGGRLGRDGCQSHIGRRCVRRRGLWRHGGGGDRTARAGYVRLRGTWRRRVVAPSGARSVAEGDRHLDLDRAISGQGRHSDR
jgi:hypothetical protein